MGSPTEVPTRRFATPAWLRALCAFGAIAFPVATYSIYSAEGLSWPALGGVVATVLAAAGAVDAFTAKVELFPERMVVVANLVRREYLRSEFVGVTWAKGVPVMLTFRSGAHLRLPDVGANAQGVSNSVRAWLRKPPADAA